MKAIKTILIGICTFALMYLAVAFVVWDLNAANWKDSVRFLVVFMGSIIGFMLSIMYYFDLNI